MRTHNTPFHLRILKRYPSYAPWPDAMISSNYPCLKPIFMIPKVFELLNFYWTLHKNMFSMRNKKNYPLIIIKYSLLSRALRQIYILEADSEGIKSKHTRLFWIFFLFVLETEHPSLDFWGCLEGKSLGL